MGIGVQDRRQFEDADHVKVCTQLKRMNFSLGCRQVRDPLRSQLGYCLVADSPCCHLASSEGR